MTKTLRIGHATRNNALRGIVNFSYENYREPSLRLWGILQSHPCFRCKVEALWSQLDTLNRSSVMLGKWGPFCGPEELEELLQLRVSGDPEAFLELLLELEQAIDETICQLRTEIRHVATHGYVVVSA